MEEDVSAAASAVAEAEPLAGAADLQVEEISGLAPAAAPAASGRSFFDGFPLSQGQEVINARAAMAGFVAAVVSEAWTQKSVWTQIAGRCEALPCVAQLLRLARVAFWAIITTTKLDFDWFYEVPRRTAFIFMSCDSYSGKVNSGLKIFNTA